MLSKEVQYRIFAGTKKEDFTGWEKVTVEESESIDYWSLDIGNGYTLDRVTKKIRGLFGSRKVRFLSIRMDRTVEDPEGDYRDFNCNMIFDVEISVDTDSIKFKDKHNSFVLLSREPIDWEEFSKGPVTSDEDAENNWSSFYS